MTGWDAVPEKDAIVVPDGDRDAPARSGPPDSGWSVRWVSSVPAPDDGLRSIVTFEVVGPPGTSVRVDTELGELVEPFGKFPPSFTVDRPTFTIASDGRDAVQVVVRSGDTATPPFSAVLLDGLTGAELARSGPAFAAFDVGESPAVPD